MTKSSGSSMILEARARKGFFKKTKAMTNLLEKIKIFFKESWTETKKIDWPTKRETINYTLIVIGISLSVAAFLAILDFIFTKLLGRFIF